MYDKPSKIIVVLGTTASGKTHLATHLAKDINGEIISADARQVYKDMDIGTGKDLEEYTIEKQKIPYHLIDICQAGERYNIKSYYKDFLIAYEQITKRNNMPILCGGSGLYLETALKGNPLSFIPINPTLRENLELLSTEEIKLKTTNISSNLKEKLSFSTRGRAIRGLEINAYLQKHKLPKYESLPLTSFIFGIDITREERRKRITERLLKRINNGLIEEVERLIKKGVSTETLLYYGLEYKWVTQYLTNVIDRPTMVEGLNIAIHQFAKRQATWFRRMEKQGFIIHWLPFENTTEQNIEIIKGKALS